MILQKDQKTIERGTKGICSLIKKALRTNEGLLIGRHGTIEFQCVLENIFQKQEIPEGMRNTLMRHAGVFPQDSGTVEDWASHYWAASLAADGMAAGWYTPTSFIETELLKKLNPGATLFPLRSLEPYYVSAEDRWTNLLKGRRVCVVSSFTKTMESQLAKKSAVWGTQADSILPSADYSFVQTSYPRQVTGERNAWPERYVNWKYTVDCLADSVDTHNPEIVLIGCGGLAMPLAHELKKRGRIAIVLGGAIQVLFGIKGNRWKTHDVISKFWNSAWVSPSPEEVPDHAKLIEGGCYW